MIVVLLDFTKLAKVVFDELEMLNENTKIFIQNIETDYFIRKYNELIQTLAILAEKIIRSKLFPYCYNTKYPFKRCVQYIIKHSKTVQEYTIALLLDQLYDIIYTKRNKVSHGELVNIEQKSVLHAITVMTELLKTILLFKNSQRLFSIVKVHPIIEDNVSRFLTNLYTCLHDINYDKNRTVIIDNHNKKQLYDCLKSLGYTSKEISRYLREKLRNLGITKTDRQKIIIIIESLINFLYNRN